MHHSFHKKIVVLVFNIEIYSLKAIQHIRMISEGSCDTEDWSNDAENSVLQLQESSYSKIY